MRSGYRGMDAIIAAQPSRDARRGTARFDILGLMGRVGAAAVVALMALTSLGAQRTTRTALRRAASTKLSTEATCAEDLGPGIKSGHEFCDVIVSTTPAGSVVMKVPAHRGTATLLFDLHNRFTILSDTTDPSQAYVRHTAIVAVVRPSGTLIGRAAVVREFRTVQDVFDRIAGSGPGGLKAVAPGQPEAVRMTIPAGLNSIGIVGVKLSILTRSLRATFATPGRPIAIVSNLRIEYTPR
jgi:hypothetical protein